MTTIESTLTAEEALAPPAGAQRILWLTNASHLVNHFLGQMVAVLYPAIMAELGFGYADLGVLTAIQNLIGNATEVIWGFFTPFLRRGYVLAVGNVVMTIGTLLTGAAGSFPLLVASRTVYAVGASAQHPIGSSLLSGYFPRKRGSILAMNSSIAAVGSLFSAPIAAVLLAIYGWRAAFIICGLISFIMAGAYLLSPDRRISSGASGGARARLAQSGSSYRRALRNRNLVAISVVMMLGAAGRAGGINQAYLGVHFENDLGASLTITGLALATLQVGAISGPLVFGWLSDRFSRQRVMQLSLLMSAIMTWLLAGQGAELAGLLPILLVYGCSTYSRNTLTQAIVADSASDEDRDAAFSLYFFVGFISAPIWSFVAGVLMERFGFALAFDVLGFSYIAGMIALLLMVDPSVARQRHTA
jgi:MFS transporter, FSR family, fosmidomycin resistance protein